MAEDIVPILRLLIIMAARDGEVRAIERRYLAWIMNKYALPADLQAQLMGELITPPDLHAVFPLIKSARDRAMSLDLLRIVMAIDGDASPEERAFYAEVVALANPETLADELVRRDYRIQRWKDLKRLGLALNRRLPFWRRYFF